jgi:hypothetical protein
MFTQLSYTPGKYGRVAALAVALYRFGQAQSPVDAWERAVAEVFPDNPASQEKGCPKGAFLGLCQEGLIKGIERGDYTNAERNRDYALKAAQLLRENPALGHDMKQLWSAVLGGEEKVHNQQMDVVLALWSEGLLQATM